MTFSYIGVVFLILLTSCTFSAVNTVTHNTFKNKIFDFNSIVGSNDRLNSEINRLLINGVVPPYFRDLLSKIKEDATLPGRLMENVSESCRNHTSAWINALLGNNNLANNTWALQMADAWPKLPEGILSGHITGLGDFDECLGIRAELTSDEEVENFQGTYCTVYIVPYDPNSNATGVFMERPHRDIEILTVDLIAAITTQMSNSMSALSIPIIGTCYPSSCSQSDITLLLTNGIKQIPVLGEYLIAFPLYCTTDYSPKLNGGDIAMITILGVILFLCFFGTAADLLLHPNSSQRNGYAIQALLAFSVYTNTKKWLNTKSGGGDNFGCIHGIRFLSAAWVVLAHTWSMINNANTWNMGDVTAVKTFNWTFYSILNGTVSVDTFFAMSGLLFAYNMLKAMQKSKGTINIPLMYVHRYLRLTPTYGLLVGLVATVYAYLGDGPMWILVKQSATACRRNWWHNLLYINNFMDYNTGDPENVMCHGETWYLANDMQFFLISPFIVYPLFKWEAVGMIVLSAVSIASIATPWIIHNKESLVPTMLLLRDVGEYFDLSYIKPWMRFGPYVVGLWAGFLLFKTANKKLKLSKLVVLAGWLLSTSMALSIIFGIMPWFDPSYALPNGLSAFYAGTHRFAWGVVICWIIFACSRGYGGPVNAFLSWKVFVPLARLTFCVYLISYTLQVLFTSRLRQTTSYDAYIYTNLFFAHLVMSLLIGFICCITMESPFIALEKLLFQGPTKAVKPLVESSQDKESLKAV